MASVIATRSIEKRCLLASFKKSVEFWFQETTWMKCDVPLEQIQLNAVEILLNGLQVANLRHKVIRDKDGLHNDAEQKIALEKFIEDFLWVQRSTQIRDSHTDNTEKSPALWNTFQNATQFLQYWTLDNLTSNRLCACLRALVTDKELLNCYYDVNAFIRSENYATAFFICLSAIELRQCSLLSQIDTELYNPVVPVIDLKHHRRSSSHPIFSISPPKLTLSLRNNIETGRIESIQPLNASTPRRALAQTVFPAFRKTKSLPNIHSIPTIDETDLPAQMRKRSKTMGAPIQTQPKNIPKTYILPNDSYLAAIPALACSSNSSSSCSGDDIQPSTSASSKKSRISDITSNSNCTTNSTSMSASDSDSTQSLKNIAPRRIELIKCDDIKIWTDPSWELKQQGLAKQPTEFRAIPQISLDIQQAKSTSPINSFLSSLFSTPPSYTSWSLNQIQKTSCNQIGDAAEATTADPSNVQQIDVPNTSSMFDSFLPVYGKKLRLRKSQNLFEDNISSLDCSTQALDEKKTKDIGVSGETTPKDCQSLTAFLQMAQLSRNNTDLEKENAHFLISEAIISAIEHIKCAKLEIHKGEFSNETTTAIDWLEHDHRESSFKAGTATETESHISEYIPYAEIPESDNCLDLHSAEVVGLSLISKFNAKQLPKISELKWLISEEDTPQNLLPMPSPTTNPDENIIPSVTRGTKYWAPPRQQIIFTDHPQPNRKYLIEKQNNRCAGCGMRVSLQYINSFRYCTYLGKYHCTGCHRNQMSATPAKILQMWDFKCYPVSVFAYRLLDQMYTYPLFYVPDLNPTLYVRSKQLLSARNKRVQLKFVKDFIKLCRFATKEHQYFNVIPDHITTDPDIWSMSDFVDAHNKSTQRSIEELIERCEHHIINCVLCTARGFICEYCQRDQVLFPWWENKVCRCERCGACFHLNCWKSMAHVCYRCQRFSKRQDEISDL